jgi:small subunit ribosomal protein S6
MRSAFIHPYFHRELFPSESRVTAEGRNHFMRSYECIFILDPSLDEQTVRDKAAKFSEVVTSRQGVVHNLDQWGKRKLAYAIKKRHEGFYTFMRFSGTTEILQELNRVFRFDEHVVRHMIVVEERPRQPEAPKAAPEGN